MPNTLESNNNSPIQVQPRMGRPVKVFTQTDWGHIEKLCSLMATEKEIAGFLDVSVDTLSWRIKETYGQTFAEYFEQKKIGAQIALRRAQWQSAMNGNVTMQIWLGKQYLGQSNKIEVPIENPAQRVWAALEELDRKE